MAKVSAKLWAAKKANGTSPVYLVVSHNRKRATVATEYSFADRHWNPADGVVRKSFPEYRKINKAIGAELAKLNAIIMDMTASGLQPEPAAVKRRYEADVVTETKEIPCFLSYCEKQLETWEGRWAYQTYLAYRTSVTKLKKWHGKKRLPFDRVTPDMLRRFQSHLARAGNTREKEVRGNTANTLHKNLSTLKGFYKQAMQDGVIPHGRNPFESLSLRKEDAVKEKLTTDEIRAIRDLDLAADSYLAEVRRWWLFAFYVGGMRFSDVANVQRKHLREDEGGAWHVAFKQGKTTDIQATPIISDALDILEFYRWRDKGREEHLFPILEGYDLSSQKSRRKAISTRNASANKALKRIQKAAGIGTSLTFHLSRHSTAGYLYEQGYDVRTIQLVLGHANVRITEQYLKGFRSSTTRAAVEALRL